MGKGSTNDDEEEAVSLRHFAKDNGDEDMRSTLDDIRVFRPTGAKDDRLTVTVPHVVHVALESLAVVAGRRTSVNSLALWALGRGLRRLDAMPEVQAICAAWQSVLRSGSDAVEQFRWTHRLGHGDSKRLYLRYVAAADQGKCAALAKGLGLDTSGFAAIPMAAGLVDAPLAGDDIPRMLLADLKEFRRRLRQRVLLAQELQRQAKASPSGTRPQISWSDVVDDD